MNYKFIGLDLAETPWTLVKNFTFTWAVIGVILIPILAGLSQFVLSKITMNSQPQANAGGNSMKSMMYTMPLFSVYIAFIMPAALGVYWIAQSVFSLIQELGAQQNAEREDGRGGRSRVPGPTGRSPPPYGGGPGYRSSRESRRNRRKRPCVKSSRPHRRLRPPRLPALLSAPRRQAGWETVPMPGAVPTRLTVMMTTNKESL